MPRIVETIVTTANDTGEVHIAPLGLIQDGGHWIIAPFKPSKTLDNLRANPFAAASHTGDVRVFAGCVTGRKTWPLTPATKRTISLGSANPSSAATANAVEICSSTTPSASASAATNWMAKAARSAHP